MIAAIIAAETAFWVLLLGGLALRYLVRARKASSVALAAVPLVDLVLVALVTVDVLRGAEPTRPHAFAVLYLGVTIAFGHPIIRKTDSWFRYRFAGGPKPLNPIKGSRAAVRGLWVEWLRVVLAAGIAAAGLLAMIAVDGWHVPADLDTAANHPYWSTLLLLAMITGIWFLAGPAFAGAGDPARDPQPAPTADEGSTRESTHDTTAPRTANSRHR